MVRFLQLFMVASLSAFFSPDAGCSELVQHVDRDGSVQFYEYKDEKGVPCFANNLDSIPPQFRKKAKIIKKRLGEYGVQAKPSAPNSSSDENTQSPQKESASPVKSLSGNRPLKVIVAITGLLLLVILLQKLGNAMGFKSIAAIVFLVLTLSTLLCLFIAHQKEVIDAYTSLKQEVFGAGKHLEGKKQQQIRQMQQINKSTEN